MTNWIIMPVRTGLKMTQDAIASFFAQDIGDVRVLLIDNASSCGITEWARSKYPAVVTIYKNPPLSVAQSWNKGLELLLGHNDHVMVVNNDVVLRPDTYRMLLESGQEFVTAVGDADPLCTQAWHPYEPIGCEDKVKIGKFLNMGININGVVHVGTNEGYEIQWYLKLGLKVVGFEPYIKAYEVCKKNYPDVVIHNMALGSKDGYADLKLTEGDGCGSTFLKSYRTDGLDEWIGEQKSTMIRRMDGGYFGPEYDCLVIDVQGMEWDVLQGAGDMIKQFKCLNIECSRTPLYEGEASADEIISYLNEKGFIPITPIEDHNDILFVRKDVIGYREHPDFSCYLMRKSVYEKVGKFNENFLRAFCEDWDYHVRLHKAGITACCINVPFYHVGSATVNTVNSIEAREIQLQADKNREYFKQLYGFAGGSKEYEEFFKHPFVATDSQS